jgi:Metallo-peptidase family M12
VLADSRTGASVRLAGIARWPYKETGSLKADLDALKAIPAAAAARDASKADLVVMVVAAGDACGIAGAIRAQPNDAFAVVALTPDCGSWRMTFTHELGHLYGSRHDAGADPGEQPFPHGHGFAQTGARDVMATDGACKGLSGNNCSQRGEDVGRMV